MVPITYHTGRRSTAVHRHMLQQAFRFFRAAGDGRYSDRALMRLVDAAENFDVLGTRPDVVVSETPAHYDEETEVKLGGIAGMLVRFDTGLTYLAVAPSSRRQGIASALLAATTQRALVSPASTLYVGRSNVVGQAFLASQQFVPTAMTATSLRYERLGSATPAEEEDATAAPTFSLDRLFITHSNTTA